MGFEAKNRCEEQNLYDRDDTHVLDHRTCVSRSVLPRTLGRKGDVCIYWRKKEHREQSTVFHVRHSKDDAVHGNGSDLCFRDNISDFVFLVSVRCATVESTVSAWQCVHLFVALRRSICESGKKKGSFGVLSTFLAAMVFKFLLARILDGPRSEGAGFENCASVYESQPD